MSKSNHTTDPRSPWPWQDPEYPMEDWQYEVANGDTLRGYAEWVAARIEASD